MDMKGKAEIERKGTKHSVRACNIRLVRDPDFALQQVQKLVPSRDTCRQHPDRPTPSPPTGYSPYFPESLGH